MAGPDALRVTGT
jgi:hypothetical protein